MNPLPPSSMHTTLSIDELKYAVLPEVMMDCWYFIGSVKDAMSKMENAKKKEADDGDKP